MCVHSSVSVCRCGGEDDEEGGEVERDRESRIFGGGLKGPAIHEEYQ